MPAREQAVLDTWNKDSTSAQKLVHLLNAFQPDFVAINLLKRESCSLY